MAEIYPVADLGSLGGWAPTPLWQQLADTSTASSVQSASSANALSFAVRLASFGHPGENNGWFVGCECRCVSGNMSGVQVHVSLWQGGSPGFQVGSAVTTLNAGGAWTWCGFNLTPGEVGSITDLSLLEIDVTKGTSPGAVVVGCAYTYLGIPAGFPHLDVDLSTGGLVVVPAESGAYLVLDSGGYRRQIGLEESGALYLDSNGEVKVWP